MKLDILIFASHSDDAELACAGTIAAQVKAGHRVGIADLTKGELGTRGTPEIRMQEAKAAGSILQLSARENLGFEDGFFVNDRAHQLKIIQTIRKYQPEIVFANAISDRHPDHGRAADLVKQSVFLSGLKQISTDFDGKPQQAWRPKVMYHYIQNDYIEPDFIVDISDFWEVKLDAIMAYKSQFYDPNSSQPNTFISSPEFLDFLKARAIAMGHRIGTKYGEGYTINRTLGVNNVFDLI